MKGTLPYVYFEGKLVPAEEAKISIASNSLQYGMTCFGGIRGYFRNGKLHVFRLADHHERLMNGSRILGLDYYMPYDQFKDLIGQLIALNQFEGDVYFRPFIYSSTQRLSPKLPGLTFDLAIYMVEMGHYHDPDHGLKLCISSWPKFSDNSLPTKAKAGGLYISSSLATTEALHAGYDDALMPDHEGYIVEASVANIMMVYRDKVIVPPLGQAFLEGVTLRTMVDLLHEEGKEILDEPIDRSMIYTCQELMLVGTAYQIAFVTSVDGRLIGSMVQHQKHEASRPGPVCLLLREKFAQILAGTHPRSKEWLSTFSVKKKT